MNNKDYRGSVAAYNAAMVHKLLSDYELNGDGYRCFGDYLRAHGFTMCEIQLIVSAVNNTI